MTEVDKNKQAQLSRIEWSKTLPAANCLGCSWVSIQKFPDGINYKCLNSNVNKLSRTPQEDDSVGFTPKS